MSDNILKLIPSSPTYVPGESAINKAVDLIQVFLPLAEDISIEISEFPRFIDQGSNWERVTCPNCNAVIDIDWWQQAMDKAFKNGFKNLVVEVPCCNLEVSLNDLRYEWPAGFAKFSIEIRNPQIELSELKLKELEHILGSSIKKIWAHY
ncbi:MAG: hypothetical protein PHI06_13475 [Desulfobulbaceae bacterium]|nr:hypothetical protein [Desulfobulbaceae bacterium]